MENKKLNEKEASLLKKVRKKDKFKKLKDVSHIWDLIKDYEDEIAELDIGIKCSKYLNKAGSKKLLPLDDLYTECYKLNKYKEQKEKKEKKADKPERQPRRGRGGGGRVGRTPKPPKVKEERKERSKEEQDALDSLIKEAVSRRQQQQLANLTQSVDAKLIERNQEIKSNITDVNAFIAKLKEEGSQIIIDDEGTLRVEDKQGNTTNLDSIVDEQIFRYIQNNPAVIKAGEEDTQNIYEEMLSEVTEEIEREHGLPIQQLEEVEERIRFEQEQEPPLTEEERFTESTMYQTDEQLKIIRDTIRDKRLKGLIVPEYTFDEVIAEGQKLLPSANEYVRQHHNDKLRLLLRGKQDLMDLTGKMIDSGLSIQSIRERIVDSAGKRKMDLREEGKEASPAYQEYGNVLYNILEPRLSADRVILESMLIPQPREHYGIFTQTPEMTPFTDAMGRVIGEIPSGALRESFMWNPRFGEPRDPRFRQPTREEEERERSTLGLPVFEPQVDVTEAERQQLRQAIGGVPFVKRIENQLPPEMRLQQAMQEEPQLAPFEAGMSAYDVPRAFDLQRALTLHLEQEEQRLPEHTEVLQGEMDVMEEEQPAVDVLDPTIELTGSPPDLSEFEKSIREMEEKLNISAPTKEESQRKGFGRVKPEQEPAPAEQQEQGVEMVISPKKTTEPLDNIQKWMKNIEKDSKEYSEKYDMMLSRDKIDNLVNTYLGGEKKEKSGYDWKYWSERTKGSRSRKYRMPKIEGFVELARELGAKGAFVKPEYEDYFLTFLDKKKRNDGTKYMSQPAKVETERELFKHLITSLKSPEFFSKQ